jgi:hypothetical protein
MGRDALIFGTRRARPGEGPQEMKIENCSLAIAIDKYSMANSQFPSKLPFQIATDVIFSES